MASLAASTIAHSPPSNGSSGAPQSPRSPRRRMDDQGKVNEEWDSILRPEEMAQALDELEGFALDELDGFSAQQIFAAPGSRSHTFDDLIVLPGAIDFAVDEVEVRTRITRRIALNIPFCSSPMDTVTEDKMAIGMALQGGIGFIHCASSVEEQANMVRRVKAFENGFILDVACLAPTDAVGKLDELHEALNISGAPVTADGQVGSPLLGFVTTRDVDFLDNRQLAVSEVMTPLDEVLTARHPCALSEANELIKSSKAQYLCVVDGENGNLKSLATRSDLVKNRDFPDRVKSKDTECLAVGAAVKSGTEHQARATALVEAGVDVLVIDSRNGDTVAQVEMLRWLKATYPELDVVAGNVASQAQARRLLEAGADGLRVGMGVGSISTSQEVKAVGRAQLSSIYQTAKLALQYDVPVIADGGIASTGAATKALCMGASCVMMGSLLAGVEESPGDYFIQDHMRVKAYRGSSSLSAQPPIKRNQAWDVSTALGVSGAVVDKGSLQRFMPYFTQSVRHGLQDMGMRSVPRLHRALYKNQLRFELRSTSAQREGGVHDLHSFSTRLYQ